MNKEFLPYELSLKLKKVGFDEPCFGYYDHQIKELDTISSEVCERLCKHDTHIKAPTFSQAFRWFREKYHLEGEISKRYRWSANAPNPDETFYQWGIFDFTLGRKNYIIWLSGYDADKGEKASTSYEEAELSCLNKLIEIVEQK
jgi:hypothetical protein